MLKSIEFWIFLLVVLRVPEAISKPSIVKRDVGLSEELENIKKYINFSVDPCDDFYEYACGNWKQIHPIPEEELEYNALAHLSSKVGLLLKKLLENPVNDPAHSEAENKAKTFYKSCVDVPNLEEESITQYKVILDSLGGWPVLNSDWDPIHFNWLNLTAQIKLFGVTGLIEEVVAPSEDDSTRPSLYIGETDFSIVKRDDFLNPSLISLLPGYKILMIDTMKEFGASEENAVQATTEIIDFERELARITIGPDDDTSQVITFNELKQKIPEIDWKFFLTTILGEPIPEDLSITLFDENYFKQMIEILSHTDDRIVANYLLWRFMITSIKEGIETKRWKVCLDQVMEAMGSAVSAMFVRQHFDDDIRKDILQVIEQMQISFSENLEKNTWLDNETKIEAETKLDAISSMIGYPKYILDEKTLNSEYEHLEIDPKNYFKNVFNSERYKVKRTYSKLWGKDVEDPWEVQPAEVNGFYHVRKNTIVIPAAILQAPVYSKHFPKAIIYGTFGSFIGHELTHGFDKDGRKYDTDGNRRNWWSNSSEQQFTEEINCLITQYNNYTVPELAAAVDGQQTLSENIADNGGLRHAFRAYQNWLRSTGPEQLEKETIAGLNLTNTQLFFVGFGQFYCGELTLAGMVASLNTDSHSLPKYRVQGSVSNFEKFAEEFKCAKGTKMNPDVKCKIW